MVTATVNRTNHEIYQEFIDDTLHRMFAAIEFEPYPEQWEAIRCTKKQTFITGGERAGKSTVGAMFLFGRSQLGTLFWIVAKDYSGARDEYEKVLVAAQKIEAVERFSYPAKDQCWMVLKGGIRIETKSLRDSKKSIASKAPDGILICETAQIDHNDYLRIFARVTEKDGWVCGTGTLEGSLGWYPDIIQYLSTGIDNGQSFSLPSWANPHIYPLGQSDPRFVEMLNMYPEDLYNERFAAIPYKPHGLVCKEFDNEIHVRPLPFNKLFPVEIAVDPGYGAAHVVLALQEVGEGLNVIDELYVQGLTTEEMILAVQQKPWGPYVTQGAIDIAGHQHQAMKSPFELWRDAGIMLLSKVVNEEDGIDCLRTWLKVNPVSKRPRVFFDPKCKGIIAEMGGGLDLEIKRRIPNIGPWMRDDNTHVPINKNNHAVKALYYYLVNKYGWVGRRQRAMQQFNSMG